MLTNRIIYYWRAFYTRWCSYVSCLQIGRHGKSVLFASHPIIENGGGIEIGSQVYFGKAARLSCWEHGTIMIGNDCHFGERVFITALEKIRIGNNLLTGNNVLISDNSHGALNLCHLQMPPINRPLVSKGEIEIGDNVWIGQNVCILSGVKIGDGAIVGANSVVTHDVLPYSVVAGAPAKIINKL